MEKGEGHWSATGIPEGYGSPKLLYNPSSETVVVELSSTGPEFRPTRLFARHRTSESYEAIGDPDDDISFESAVTCDSLPLIAFNAVKWDRSRMAGNWLALYLFNLLTKEIKLCIASTALVAPEPYTNAWISKLVHLTGDGQNLYVTAGMKRPSQGRVEHILARFGIADHGLHPLSKLRNTFL